MDDNHFYAAAQARCDSVAQAFGMEAPRWLQGETLNQYRVRLLSEYKPHSPTWKNANLAVVANDAAAFGTVESAIYKDAYHVASNPRNDPGAPLTARTRVDSSGHRITTFHGDPIEAWKPFMGAGVRYLVGVDKHPGT